MLGTFDAATFTYAGTTSTFDVRDGTYVVRTDGADGELHDFEIAYTFGVDPLQQYLVSIADGELDHEDVLHWTGLAQNWNFMCAECHSTNVEKNYTLDTDSYATSWSDIDVSCESCHGPGSETSAEAVTPARYRPMTRFEVSWSTWPTGMLHLGRRFHHRAGHTKRAAYGTNQSGDVRSMPFPTRARHGPVRLRAAVDCLA